MKTFINEYIEWIIKALLIILILTILIYVFDVDSESGIQSIDSKKSSFEIIENNSKIFLYYFLLFPIMPVLFLLDLTSITTNIYFSFRLFGIWYTVENMYAHFFIEFFNLLFYTYLSYINFRVFWEFRSIKYVIKNVKKNYQLYLFSYLFLIIAGLVEGIAYA
ncbi:MAG: hypothetical protein Q4B23_04870 [Helcococcus sp.]|nr:hypothetical protein [Helcococcus sp.]